MASIMEIMQLCRLCLVKDQVNIPIFEDAGDIRQIFLKISACLPVKVSKEDNLPKKICDGCSYKLDLLYQFWNTSASSEKQLLTWLNEIGIEKIPKEKDSNKRPQPNSLGADTVILKQEAIDPPDTRTVDSESDELPLSNDAHDYIIQQQQLPYQNVGFPYQGSEQASSSNVVTATVTSNAEEAPKRKRRAAAMKAAIHLPESDEDDDDLDMTETKIAKMEEESESDDCDDPEPTTFVGVPSTSTDNEQPGPSGVGKNTTDAPDDWLSKSVKEELLSEDEIILGCDVKPETNSPRIQKQKKYTLDNSSDELYTPKNTFNETKRKRFKRIWTCTKCLAQYDNSRHLRAHRKIHRKEVNDAQYNYKYDEEKNIYTCNTCEVEFSDKGEVEKHVKLHDEIYNCDVCSTVFDKPYNYACHMYTHSEDKMFQCPLCGHKTNKRTAISQHINNVHYHKYIYNCEECGRGFNDFTIFKEHTGAHRGAEPFCCIVCSKNFTYSKYMVAHQIRFHRPTIEGEILPNQCPVCFKVFAKQQTLVKHAKKHEKVKKQLEKRHLCDICGKGFAHNTKLRVHYRIHTGVKPYSCSYCEKSFTKKDYLTMHERVHNGEKPYSCEYCGKKFNQGAPLRLHIRSHTGERPYVCHLCNKGYISKGALNVHFKSCPGSVV